MRMLKPALAAIAISILASPAIAQVPKAADGKPAARNNAIMGAQVKQFSDKELKAIAQYLGSLPSDVHTVPQAEFR